MNSRQKGGIGHRYTEEWLKSFGWSVHTEGHQQIIYQRQGSGFTSPRWGSTGRNDAFSVPDPSRPGHNHGGFDHFAVRKDGLNLITTLWQTKKTKVNPFTPANKSLIIRCADAHRLPLAACFLIWWGNGAGPKSKRGPVIWRADWAGTVDFNPNRQLVLATLGWNNYTKSKEEE